MQKHHGGAVTDEDIDHPVSVLRRRD